MSNDPDSSDRNSSGGMPPGPDCPVCGDPVTFVTATGPYTGSVRPCGCSVPPTLLEDD